MPLSPFFFRNFEFNLSSNDLVETKRVLIIGLKCWLIPLALRAGYVKLPLTV